MNGFLRASTASQVRTIGPFVSDSDFKTLSSALTIANTDIKLKKNGAASASKNSGGATADGTNGLYQITLDATDTATVGELSLSVKVAGALVYFANYTVLTAAAYDATFASTATGYVTDQAVNVTKWSGNATTTGDIAIKTTLAKTTHVTGFNDISTANVQTELVTYGALKPTVATRTLDVTTTGEAGVDWANVGGQGTTVGLTATTIATVTNATNVTNPVALTAAYDAAKTASSQASNDQIYSTIDTEVAAIKAKTDQLVFTVANRVDATATMSLSAGDLTSIADAILKRDFSSVSGESARSLLNAARFLRNKFSISGTTLTVTKEDDASPAWTSTLSVDAAAQPIVGSDPA